MNKKLKAVISVTFVFLFVLSVVAVNPVDACNNRTQTTRGEAYGIGYTQIIGSLGDASYVIRLPDNWNKELIIGCRSYYNAYSPTKNPDPELQFDALAAIFIAQGYAYAASDYGAQGYCVKEGMKATYQLTTYVIQRYHVRGDVFIFGGSMGGQIALLLADKYPGLYSGVLDMCGPKDMVLMYKSAVLIANSNLTEIRSMLGWPAIIPDSSVQGFKDFCTLSAADIEKETNGKPESNLRAYTRISPVNNTHIKTHVTSLVGALDFVVPLSQTMEYQTAITKAGRSSLYTMIVVPTGGHIDNTTMTQAPAALSQLISLANNHHCPINHCYH